MNLAAIVVLVFSGSAQGEITANLAARYFQEARWISADDGGRLWGKELYGPMIFVSPASRAAAANERPPVAGFHEESGVFLGPFPESIGIANYAFNWGGRRWTMVMWPLPQNRAERATLMAHELFHRIQPDLGMPGASPKNAHLETLEGRLWLQLEYVALGRALQAADSALRTGYVRDALLFRAWRQGKFPGAKAEEDALELNEGLAQFTGYMNRGGWEPENRGWLGGQLLQGLGRPSYTRSFAYWTGAAYAFLLNLEDAAGGREAGWRAALKSDSSLSGMLASTARIEITSSESEAVARAKAYGYDEILSKERAIEADRNAKIAAVRKRLVEDPVLLLLLSKMNVTFDNRTILAMGGDGTFYGAATIRDEWGRIEVTDGILVSADFKAARVQAPSRVSDRNGNGWTLHLNPGWTLQQGPRPGDFQIAKASSTLAARS